ncbi:MAG: putative sporulation protein YtxC [Romboutsia sp.]
MLEEYTIAARSFLQESRLEKKLVHNDDHLEIILSIDEEKPVNIKKISEEIANLIVDIMEDSLLKEYVMKNYNKNYLEYRNGIYSYSLNLLRERESEIKDSIYERIYTYILNNDYLDIDGFVKFRIKEFTKYISKVSDLALEEYLIKKNQDEFTNVLKYFIDMQEDKIDYIKIHIVHCNYIVLYDKDGNKIDNLENEDILSLVIQENLNYQDILISTLLTLCPKKIEVLDSLNNNISKEIIETVRSIFGDRVNMSLKN